MQAVGPPTPQSTATVGKTTAGSETPTGQHWRYAKTVASSTNTKQQAIAEHEAANKKHNIQQWQHNMRHDAAARYKWVNQGRNTTPLSQVTNNQPLTTDQHILDTIHKHWETIWQSANPQAHQAQATGLVLSHLPQGEKFTERPTLKDFTKVRARLKGAAGPELWTHQEIRLAS